MPALAYLLTFNTYGSWLHGDERGSIAPNQNTFGEQRIPPNPHLEKSRRDTMKEHPYQLDTSRQRIVLDAILHHIAIRKWQIWAAHIRPTHAHLVASGDIAPERMLNEFKSYASRALNASNVDKPDCKRWARHGSTKHLFTEQSIVQAVRYVIDDQGEKTTWYEPRPQGSVR